jgi:hypothetical protein
LRDTNGKSFFVSFAIFPSSSLVFQIYLGFLHCVQFLTGQQLRGEEREGGRVDFAVGGQLPDGITLCLWSTRNFATPFHTVRTSEAVAARAQSVVTLASLMR